jgi:hypothetical protein
MLQLTLPQPDAKLTRYTLAHQSPPFASVTPGPFNRTAYAAAHVVANPRQSSDPWDGPTPIDWDATLRFREHLWRLGFKVAEAMDTSQRGMGLDWNTARELIRRSVAHARTIPGADLACGVGTDQLAWNERTTVGDVLAAYSEQIETVEAAGGRIILMASRALAAIGRSADDYREVYAALLRRCRQKVILHWLGEMFDPALKGYWGSADLNQATDTALGIIRDHADKVDGIKVSLLDAQREIDLRRRLPPGVKMFTGDDFNYGELIAGDGAHHSHGLLGIFDPIAPIAAKALQALAKGDVQDYRRMLDPTVILSREIFRAPTRHYKAGVVFLAWLNGHQDHFTMVGGVQSARDVLHYARVFELADRCGALTDPSRAVHRMRQFLSVSAGLEG